MVRIFAVIASIFARDHTCLTCTQRNFFTHGFLQDNQLVKFQNVLPDHDHIRAALATDLPVVIGLSIYESFQSKEVAKTGGFELHIL